MQAIRTQLTPRPARAALAAILVGLGCVLSAIDPGLAIPPWAGALVVVGTAVLLAWSIWRARSRDLLAPTVFFPVVLLGYYGLGSLPVGSWGTVPLGALLLVLIGAGAFVLGASIVSDETEYARFRLANDHGIDPRRLVLLLVVVATCAAIGFGVIFAASGIPILGSVEGERVRASSSGYINTLALSIRAVVMVAAVALALGLLGRRRAFIAAAIALAVVGLALVASTGNRGHLVLLLIFGVAVIHYAIRQLTARVIVVLGLVGLIGYSMTGYLRSAQCDSQWAERVEAHYGVPAEVAPLAPAYLSVRSVPVFLSRVVAVVPEAHDHTGGAMLLSPILTSLPGHQPGIGEFIKTNVLGLEFVGFGVAAGLFSPAYIDFGYGGVVSVLLAAGIATQWLYRRARTSPAWLAVYAFVVANLTLSVYGSLVNSFSVLWLPTIAFVVLHLARTRTFPDRADDRRASWPRHLPQLAGAGVAVGLIVLVGISGVTVGQSIARATTSGGPIVIDLPGGSDDPEVNDDGPSVPTLGCGL